jgi:Carbohydrate binding domain
LKKNLTNKSSPIMRQYLLFTLILIASIGAVAFTNDDPYTTFENPSFEDPNPRAAASPEGWQSKSPNSTPDIFPGAWGLLLQPYEGTTCIGLVTRKDGSSENISQCLSKSLQKGTCYTFKIWLAHAPKYVGHNSAVRLQVWGGNSISQKSEALCTSPTITHGSWKEYTFSFTPKQTIKCLTLEAAFPSGASFRYNGNILLDACTAIYQCSKA